jgi:site-specific DNA recombinase
MKPLQPFPPSARIVAYLRDSGGERQDLSTGQQETEIRAWCNAQGLILNRIFRDEARPGGSTVGRVAFQDMMHYFRNGAGEAGLVIWSWSRFARDIDDSQFHRADLRRRGYILHSLTDPVPDGAIGRLFEAAIDWKNEQFREDLSRDVKRGLSNLVTRFGCVPGTPPTGFKREPVDLGHRRDGKPHVGHRWVPDPDFVPRIRQAFEMRAAGHSLHEINQETRLFGSLNSYTTFWQNKLYIGILEYGGQVIADYCEPVVDRALWEAVQPSIRPSRERSASNGPDHPRRASSPFLLSGLAVCRKCGAPLSGLNSRQRNKAVYRRYECTRSRRRRDCDFTPIPARFLEQLVIDDLQAAFDAENLTTIRGQLEGERAGFEAQRREKISEHRKDLGAVRRQINNITNAIADMSHSRSLLEKLDRLEGEEADLLAKIDALEMEIAGAALPSHQEAVDQVEIMHKAFKSGDPDDIRRVLRSHIERVSVEREGGAVRGEIRYYFPSVAIGHAPVGAQE